MISESINSSIEEGALKTVFDEYDKQIAAIWSAIGDLASRIQSLVYVPENARGYAFFRGATLGDYKLTEGKRLRSRSAYRPLRWLRRSPRVTTPRRRP